MYNFKCAVFLFSILYFANSCGKKTNNSDRKGVLHSIVKEYDSTYKFKKNVTEIPGEFKVWFRDSFIIEEIKSTSIISINNTTSIKRFVDHYTFVDLRNGFYYDYKSFFDTAALIRKYSRYDKNLIFGIDFYGSAKIKSSSPVQPITDTTVNKIFYKRYKVFLKPLDSNNTSPVIAIVYSRPDLTNFLLDSRKGLDIDVSFPITRMDYLPTKETPLILSFETEFLADTLSANELKVFKAWEKNAKEHPVIPK